MRRAATMVVFLALAAPAAAQTTLPYAYNQGLAALPGGEIVFSGTNALYRLDASGREVARNESVIAPGLDFNHVGDIAYDTREGGRLLLPLECYVPMGNPGAPDPGNTCGRGAIGVADPVTLQWRYHVELDPAEIPKAMWLATAPDGLLWTQSGSGLLAYRAGDVVAGAAPLRAAALGPAVCCQMSGGAFLDGRLWLARQDELASVDLATGATRVESSAATGGETEGLEAFDALGGRMHWLIASGEALPTRGIHWSRLLHFGDGPGARGRPARIAVRVQPRRVDAGRRVRLRVRAQAVVAGRRESVAGAIVRVAGRSAFTDAGGRAELRVRARPPLRVVVRGRHLRAGLAIVGVRRAPALTG